MTTKTNGGGYLNDLISLIIFLFISLTASLAYSNIGNALSKSDWQDSLISFTSSLVFYASAASREQTVSVSLATLV
jgi:hypothetical protein